MNTKLTLKLNKRTIEKVIEQLLNSGFNDFEDAIQYFTAVNNGIKLLLTRNKGNYKKVKFQLLLHGSF